MTNLDWRPIQEVRLREALVPDPAGTGRLDTLAAGRLAVDSGLLYLDPRPDSDDPGTADYVVTAVPLAGVIAFSYRMEGPRHSSDSTRHVSYPRHTIGP